MAEHVSPEEAELYRKWQRGGNKPKVTRVDARREVRGLKKKYRDELVLREHLKDDIAEIETEIRDLVDTKKKIAMAAVERAQELMMVDIPTDDLTESERAKAVEAYLRITSVMPGVTPEEGKIPGLSPQGQQVLINIKQEFGHVEAETLVDDIVSEDAVYEVLDEDSSDTETA